MEPSTPRRRVDEQHRHTGVDYGWLLDRHQPSANPNAVDKSFLVRTVSECSSQQPPTNAGQYQNYSYLTISHLISLRLVRNTDSQFCILSLSLGRESGVSALPLERSPLPKTVAAAPCAKRPRLM